MGLNKDNRVIWVLLMHFVFILENFLLVFIGYQHLATKKTELSSINSTSSFFWFILGLLRCGKSCRLRWINYLRPDIKRGHFTEEEEEVIIKLHALLGNK